MKKFNNGRGNKALMKSNQNKKITFDIKKLLKSKSVSGEPFSGQIGDTYKKVNEMRGELT